MGGGEERNEGEHEVKELRWGLVEGAGDVLGVGEKEEFFFFSLRRAGCEGR